MDNNSGNKKEFQHLINNQITVSPVLLVDTSGGENELLDIKDALDRANNAGLDLVLINAKSNPPIVKILDYGKFIYELKKQKSGKKHVSKVKSITVKPQISSHDIGGKSEMAIDGLKQGDKVQFVIKTPGRMAERTDLIFEVYDMFTKLVEKFGKPKDELKKISKIQYATYFFPIKK